MSLADVWLRLFYRWADRESLDYRIRLVTTRPHFGGVRWWFICPLVVNGQPCGRRIRKLYLAPGSKYFGCRHCLNLTYTSAQEHDKRVDVLREDPQKLHALVSAGVERLPVSKLGLLMRALARL